MLTKIKQYQKIIIDSASHLKDIRVVGLLVFLLIAFMVSWSGVKAIDANYGLQKQISRLDQENEVQKLSNENLRLQNDYYNTPQYLEIAARQEFGLAAPGETVLQVPRSVALSHTVDIPGLEPQIVTKDKSKKPFYQKNFQAWMDFLLHRQPQ